MTTDRPATLAVGDHIPDVELRTMTVDGPATVRSTDVLGHGKVVLIAVSGAFTPLCSGQLLPAYVEGGAALKADKRVDTLACIAVNDVFVLDAWAQDQGVGEDILMLADGNATFTRAVGLAVDASAAGLGTRSQRYAAVLQDGVVTHLVVDGAAVDRTTCANIARTL